MDLDVPAVRDRVAAAREHLSPFLLHPYDRQPHITLFVCGFLDNSSDYDYDDDYREEQFQAHLRSLARTGVAPFSLELGRLRSFASAPYLEVSNPDQGLARLRSVLAGTMPEVARSTYVPHVTVGIYGGTYPADRVLDRIASFPSGPLDMAVQQIAFVTYDAAVPAGPLTVHTVVPLQK